MTFALLLALWLPPTRFPAPRRPYDPPRTIWVLLGYRDRFGRLVPR